MADIQAHSATVSAVSLATRDDQLLTGAVAVGSTASLGCLNLESHSQLFLKEASPVLPLRSANYLQQQRDVQSGFKQPEAGAWGLCQQ